MSITEKDFRKAMGHFATGVAIITTQYQGKPIGVTINTLTSVSLDPPLVLFCLGKKRVVFPAFSECTHLAIHILSATQEPLCRSFAQPLDNHWDNLNHTMSESGCPLIPNTLGILLCKRSHTYEGGDHLIFLNHIEDFLSESDETENKPLIYFKGAFS
ncbi:MAG: flavin reductase family protein [Alphaproteobacteria bacterium]|nr:flavin reductase family protein [Alphaproteobacteria bacterium]